MGLIFGERPIVITRELTKIHEEVIRTTAAEAAALGVTERGEICVVIGPMTVTDVPPANPEPEAIAEYFGQLINNVTIGRRQAAARTARHFGLSTNDVYALLEKLKGAPPS
jgi:16S rRNA (cytidine1402-2'-O)-methyltransferase